MLASTQPMAAALRGVLDGLHRWHFNTVTSLTCLPMLPFDAWTALCCAPGWQARELLRTAGSLCMRVM